MKQIYFDSDENLSASKQYSVMDLVAETVIGMTHFAEGLTIAVQAGWSSIPDTIQENGVLHKGLKDA